MNKNLALKIILGISVVGILFSGYLSYYELFVPEGCGAAVISCGSKSVTLATLPACVYGLIMYLLVFIISALALKNNPQINEN